MRLDNIPLFDAIRGRLGWLEERQRVIAQNVANSDTPGFAARDLRAPDDFAHAMMRQTQGVGMMRTSTAHIAMEPQRGINYASMTSPDSETTLDGNSVVVEEQMLRMAESRMAHDAAIGFYQKSLNMLRMAARKPGAG
ncbi:flagellar basal body rod protein FlgB [Brevundimonas sp. BAL450]|uniref:Flagellar basal body rod protein FlgB n=1 Tax=Brevundimonas abyssalis TAR-001 TaxID=1391729 RepID=A0A8E0KLX2_9CAUL|nr:MULTISPECIES: flagellar basal body rod protein FlgB [Brevundimonas]MBG7613830.1 flagellar basal body rod protein FlgB [Brevundimonas sp. BAL450]GAD58117.1 flagellar basal-body rod protein flgB [Brevundimonas abyssalis TAR-001]